MRRASAAPHCTTRSPSIDELRAKATNSQGARAVTRVAIAGPGLMGLGIAQVCAAAGLDVVLLGRDAAAAQAGLQRLDAQLQHQVARGRLAAPRAADVRRRVDAGGEDADLGACDLAIESVVEDRVVKLQVLHRLQAAMPPGSLIASNTSGLPIAGLGASLRRPERFIGLHFFSPVERMPLVEVVRARATATASVREALDFVERIGQRPIVVRDGPGFFTSRVFAAYLDEALAMVGEGVLPELVEQAGLANGRALGPLAVLDEVSLSLNLQQARQARADGLDERFCRPLAQPVLAWLVEAGREGRRQGGGFYEHGADGRRLWPGLAELFPPRASQPALSQVQQRLRLAETLEALRCLEEGVIDSADDADAGSLLGLGYPAASGGVLRWAEGFGLQAVVEHAAALARQHGARFEPTDWLRERAHDGRGLQRWRTPTTEGVNR